MNATNRDAQGDDGRTTVRATIPSGAPSSRFERMVSATVGSALLFNAMRRPSPRAAALAAGAGALVARGLGGQYHLYRALGRSSGRRPWRRARKLSADGMPVERSITVGKSQHELYEFFRDSNNLASLLRPFADVQSQHNGNLRFRVRDGLDQMEWTTRIVQEIPNELFVWRTDEAAPLAHEGSVRLRPAPAGRGTIVTIGLRFSVPGGPLGRLSRKFLASAPKALEETVLRRCKSLCETGEVATLDRNPSARIQSSAFAGVQ